MLQVTNVGLRFGDKELYKDVNLKFTKGNCYGIIGANGAGKTTFLKILAGDIEPNTGSVSITEKERMSVLRQDHFKYDEDTVLDVVIMGHARLYEIMKEKDALYMKEDFSEEDGIKAAELEGEFAELDGWDAETNAEKILMGLGIDKDLHYKQMKELEGGEKVKVLLAQALFGKPEILLLDEPTNHLDISSKEVLEEALKSFEGTILFISHDRYFINKIATRVIEVQKDQCLSYNGNYDDYLAQKTPVIETTQKVVTESKQRQIIDKKTKNEIKKLERTIDSLEKEINSLKEELNSEEVMNNYKKYNEITDSIEEKEMELMETMEKWEQLQA